MELGFGSFGLSFVAGLLSTLSPCVLPIVPIILGAAASSHRMGKYALIGGLMLSFTLIGVVLGSLGASIGLEQDSLRNFGGVILVLLGSVLISSFLQQGFAALIGRMGIGQNLLARFDMGGWQGQFLLGVLLGVVWSPCVGPTLGVAITLAAQGQSLLQVSAVMALFSLGAALPLLLLGSVSGQALASWRGRMLNAGQTAKKIFGAALLLLGLLILTGADKTFEKWALQTLPDWLVTLTSRY